MRELKTHVIRVWAAGAIAKCGRRVASDKVTAYREESDCRACGGTKKRRKGA